MGKGINELILVGVLAGAHEEHVLEKVSQACAKGAGIRRAGRGSTLLLHKWAGGVPPW